MPGSPNNAQVLATAIEAVVKAGDMQMATAVKDLHVEKKGRIDLVTEVDLGVERAFRTMIDDRFPDHEVLAEEMGLAAGGSDGRPRWIFDPVDGTTNYAHGLPIFCASLALELRGVVEVAAVYDPTRRELFTAERGGGAYMNGVPLGVSDRADLVDALLVTGFPYDIAARQADLVPVFGRFLAEARAVRRLGSAALDLCYVAAGRFDGFWEVDLKPWDVAAGALIVEESGGRVCGYGGARFTPYGRSIVASNGHLQAAMLEVIDAGAPA